MSNIAYYLKYRPKTLSELIGQEAVKKSLQAAFENNRLSHAYLFVGPRGVGKTSTARILAKMVNCEKSTVYSLQSTEVGSRKSEDNQIPCNKCSTCISITDGSNLDLIEIDAASNRGIEDIRALREKIKLAPTKANKKVYIIDEVHMLTQEAFNALLKTLEEPPSHAIFILATTEGTKIPQTILSRVQRLDFKLATTEELLDALKKIVSEEKIDINDEALKAIAKKGEGSFRDSIKLLDQLNNHKGKITADLAEEFLKSVSTLEMVELLESLAKRDTKESLIIVSRLFRNGAEPKNLLISLMDILRDLIFIKNSLGEQLVKTHLTEDKYERYVQLSQNFTNSTLTNCLDILQKGYEKLKSASIPELPVELAVLEICEGETTKTIDDGKLKIEVEDRSLRVEEQKEIHTQSSIIKNLPSTIDHPSSNSDSSDILKLKEKWTYVCETIRPYNFSLEALLRSINIVECTQTNVFVEVPYSFHQRILEAPKNRELLESILSDVLGRGVRLSTVLGNRPQRKEDIVNIEMAEDDEIIRAAAEIFNADSVN